VSVTSGYGDLYGDRANTLYTTSDIREIGPLPQPRKSAAVP
jgi:hypothetical protein